MANGGGQGEEGEDAFDELRLDDEFVRAAEVKEKGHSDREEEAWREQARAAQRKREVERRVARKSETKQRRPKVVLIALLVFAGAWVLFGNKLFTGGGSSSPKPAVSTTVSTVPTSSSTRALTPTTVTSTGSTTVP